MAEWTKSSNPGTVGVAPPPPAPVTATRRPDGAMPPPPSPVIAPPTSKRPASNGTPPNSNEGLEKKSVAPTPPAMAAITAPPTEMAVPSDANTTFFASDDLVGSWADPTSSSAQAPVQFAVAPPVFPVAPPEPKRPTNLPMAQPKPLNIAPIQPKPTIVAPIQPKPAILAPSQPVQPKPSTPPASQQKGRGNRMQRMALSLPVVIHQPFGKTEKAQTVFVLSRGAVLTMTGSTQTGQKLNLTNPNNGKEVECRVTSVEPSPKGNQVEVEFTQPAPEFWPVSFPADDWNADDRRRAADQPTPAVESPISTGAEVQSPLQPAQPSPINRFSKDRPANDYRSTAPVQEAPTYASEKASLLPLAEALDENLIVEPTTFSPPSTQIHERERRIPATTPSAHDSQKLEISPIRAYEQPSPSRSAPAVSQRSRPRKAEAEQGSNNKWIFVGLGVALVVGASVGVMMLHKTPENTTAQNTPAITAPATNTPTTEPVASAPPVVPANDSPAPASRNHQPTARDSNNSKPALNKPPTPTHTAAPAVVKTPSSLNPIARTSAPKEEAPPVLTATAGPATGAIPMIPTGGRPVVLSTPQPPVQAPSRVKSPHLLSSVPPVYPSAAKSGRVEGDVVIEAEIDIHGNVVKTKVVSGPPLLQGAASDAVRRWKYEPATLNDKPVPGSNVVKVQFHLK